MPCKWPSQLQLLAHTLPGMIIDHRVRRKPWALLPVTPKQTETRNQNITYSLFGCQNLLFKICLGKIFAKRHLGLWSLGSFCSAVLLNSTHREGGRLNDRVHRGHCAGKGFTNVTCSSYHCLLSWSLGTETSKLESERHPLSDSTHCQTAPVIHWSPLLSLHQLQAREAHRWKVDNGTSFFSQSDLSQGPAKVCDFWTEIWTQIWL